MQILSFVHNKQVGEKKSLVDSTWILINAPIRMKWKIMNQKRIFDTMRQRIVLMEWCWPSHTMSANDFTSHTMHGIIICHNGSRLIWLPFGRRKNHHHHHGHARRNKNRKSQWKLMACVRLNGSNFAKRIANWIHAKCHGNERKSISMIDL